MPESVLADYVSQHPLGLIPIVIAAVLLGVFLPLWWSKDGGRR